MMIMGRIFKSATSRFWPAEAPILGVYTQGTSRADAEEMLADAIEEVMNHKGFAVTITRLTGNDVLIEANDAKLLAAAVLRYQREAHNLSLADVAKRLHAKSRNAYAEYERGLKEPTLGKFSELLAAVAPEMTMIVGSKRKPAAR